MGMEMIHNAMLEYMPGTPYAVFTYTIADLDLNGEPVHHLYAAFIKREHTWAFADGAKLTDRRKIIKRYRLLKEMRDEINRIIKESKHGIEPVTPKDLYENGIKELMPVVFDESDVVLEIARYDAVYCPKFTGIPFGTPDAEIKRLASKMYDLKQNEMVKQKEKDRHKNNYITLQKLIDNWLSGKMYIKDVNEFLEMSDFRLVKEDKELSTMRHIDMFTHDHTASLREAMKPGEVGGGQYCEYSVTNTFSDPDGAKEELKYYADNKDFLARWVACKVKGKDIEELEERSHLTISGDEMISRFRDYLGTCGFRLDTAEISCYDPVNDIECSDAEAIDIPTKVIQRFRETGRMLLFDEEMIEKKRRDLAKRRLLGCAGIRMVDMTFDPETFKVEDVTVTYET